MTIDYMTAKGWLRDDEREGLKRLASEVGPQGCIINIGVEYGASIACLRAGNPTARIVGLDIDMSKFVMDVYLATSPLLFEADSGNENTVKRVKTVVQDWYEGDKCAGLVFVDGDHNYEGVVRDLVYTGMICGGGTIVFHDYYGWSDPEKPAVDPWVKGVNRAVDEWFAGNQNDWEEMPHIGTMRIFKRL